MLSTFFNHTLPSGKLTQLLNMIIYSWFTYYNWWFSSSLFVCLPEGIPTLCGDPSYAPHRKFCVWKSPRWKRASNCRRCPFIPFLRSALDRSRRRPSVTGYRRPTGAIIYHMWYDLGSLHYIKISKSQNVSIYQIKLDKTSKMCQGTPLIHWSCLILTTILARKFGELTSEKNRLEMSVK